MFRCFRISPCGTELEVLYEQFFTTVITAVTAINNSFIALGDSDGNLTFLKRNRVG